MCIGMLSESMQWGVGILAPIVLAVVSLAFKAKIMTAVEEKMKPIRDEVTNNKKEIDGTLSEIKIEMAVTSTTMKGLIDVLKDNQRELKELIREKDENSKRNFEIVFEKLDKKEDKK